MGTEPAQMLFRAYSVLTAKAVDEEKRIVEGIASTPAADRLGDIVEPMGAEFEIPMPLLWQHDHLAPVGQVEFAKPTKNGIPFRARIEAPQAGDPPAMRDRLEEAWRSVKRGLVRAVSIGFRDLEHAVMEGGGWRFLRWEWLELSLVTIPANAEATITTIRSIDRGLRAAPGPRRDAVILRSNPAGVAAPRKPLFFKDQTVVKTLSEQKTQLQATRESKISARQALQDKAAGEGRAKSAEEKEQFDTLTSEIATLDSEIKDIETLELANVAKTAKAANGTSPQAASRSRDPDYRDDGRMTRASVLGLNSNMPKGIGFVRYVKCLANAAGNPQLAAMLAEKEYPDDARIAHYARLPSKEKAAVGAAHTGGSGWADALASANLIAEFIDLLRAETVLDKFGKNGVPDFRRVPFNVKVARQTGGTTANWTGQGKPIAVSKGAFDQITIPITKIEALTYATKEQLEFSAVDAEALLLRDLVEKSAEKADTSFFGTAAAVSGVSPAGMLNGLSAISSAGADFDDVITDLTSLLTPLYAAKIKRSSVVLVTNEDLANAIAGATSQFGILAFPEVMAAGRLRGLPLLSSGNVRGGDFIAVSASNILMAGQDTVEISVSDQASIETLDSALTQDATAGTGTSLVSLWQNDSIGIKVKRPISWAKASSAAVSFIDTAAYGGAPSA